MGRALPAPALQSIGVGPGPSSPCRSEALPVGLPRADRPLMPGDGIAGPEGGTGLLPWRWAEEKLGLIQHDLSGSPTRGRFG